MTAMTARSLTKIAISRIGTFPRGLRRLTRAALLATAGAALLLGAATAAGDPPRALSSAQPVPAVPGASADPAAAGDAPSVSAVDAPAFISEGTATRRQLNLLLNKSLVLNTRSPYKRVSIAQPDIADVNLLGPGNLLLTGKKAGTTQVIVWDEADKAVVLDVTVAIDVAGLQDQLKELYPDQHISVESVNGSVMLRGHVPTIATAEQVLQIAKSYAPNVMDGLEVSGGQQVSLQVRFAEVSRSASTELGINAAFGSNKYAFGSNIGQVSPTALGPGLSDPAVSPASAVTLYGTGRIGSVILESYVDALRQNDLARVLAEPNLVTVSGQEASFLAGGSFPIPVAQGGGSGSGAAISIEYRDYGVKLKFIPVVLGNGRIRLKMSPEVSDLDYANGVTLNNFVVPGTTQRNLTTTVELADGQTLAVAGLLNSSIASDKSVTPLLGDLPVVGSLFRSVRYQKKDTELVVLVTPHLVEPLNPSGTPQAPGEEWRSPTEGELFLDQYMGTDLSTKGKGPTTQQVMKMAESRQAPAFYGQIGYIPPASQNGPAPAPVASGRD